MLFRIILSGLILSGCAQLQDTPTKPALLGAGAGLYAGIQAKRIANKLREDLSPEYKLLVDPIEICAFLSDGVECSLVPCNNQCTIKYTHEEFVQDHPKVVTMRSSDFANAVAFCKKHDWKVCISYLGNYEDRAIILTEEEDK